MGIFGWSYPPGCSSVPGDEDWQCEVCGKVDDCCCPECEVCGVQGDPKCYTDHGMTRTQEQIDSRASADKWEAERAERDREEGDFWAARAKDVEEEY